MFELLHFLLIPYIFLCLLKITVYLHTHPEFSANCWP